MKLASIFTDHMVLQRDMPIRVFGTGEGNVTIMMYEQIRAMKRVAEELKLTREDIEDIFCGNAKRLLGMK